MTSFLLSIDTNIISSTSTCTYADIDIEINVWSIDIEINVCSIPKFTCMSIDTNILSTMY